MANKKKAVAQKQADHQQVDSESRAIYVAFAAAVAGFLVAFVTSAMESAFFGKNSIGFHAAVLVAIVSFVIVIAVRRTYYQKQGKKLSTLQKVNVWAEQLSLAFVYSMTGLLLTLAVFFVINQSFVGLDLDRFSAALLVALFVGLAAYVQYLLARSMDAIQLSSVLGVFLVSGVLTSMMTASDPEWWQLHFSSLGAGGGVSGYAFNGTLIIAGLSIAAVAGFVSSDFAQIQTKRPEFQAVRTKLIRVFMVLLGLFLACVGAFVYNVHPEIHNSAAGGMAIMFVALAAGLPWIAPAFSRAFFTLSYAMMLGILFSFWLMNGAHYFSLTMFEMTCAAVIFGWIIVFIRQVAAYKKA